MDVFMICLCIWASIATLSTAWAVVRVSDNRARASIENAKTLAIEARVAADREGA